MKKPASHQARTLLFDLALLEIVSVAQLLLQESLELLHAEPLHLIGEVFQE